MRRRASPLRPLSRLELVGELALLLLVRYAWPEALAAAPISLAFWGIVFAAIIQALTWIGEQAVTLAITAAQVAVWLGQAAWRILQATGTAFGRVTGFLQRFWSNVLRPFVSAVWRDLQSAYRWVKRWGDRAIAAIEKVRARVMAIYDTWFRPVFDAIDATRQTLRLLATLHVPFAREIERRLAELEDRLLEPIHQVMRRLNQAIDWINRIVTLDGYIQRITWLASQWRYVAESWELLLRPLLAGVSASHNATLHARAYPEVDPHTIAQSLADYYSSGAGELAPAINSGSAAWRASMDDAQ